ncbi:MAG: tetratricopeptide repeat protein [Proteobacteria bacterium]|nr:tetratricopeptide repeat protein [Pseudomonadota bacterium]
MAGALAALLGSTVCPAQAQGSGGPPTVASGDLERQYNDAFQEMLAKPANLDILFKFASLASQTGDLEGAVAALERMLLINPDLPRVRLELGVLYYRLGSYEAARTYLESALKSPTLPPEVRTRATRFMSDVEGKERPSHFSGDLFVGWRYQSNANLGPATNNVLLFGQIASLNQQAVGTSDWGVVSSAQIRHSYDLGRQDKSAIETTLSAYVNRQFRASVANVTLLDLTTGPRFQIFNGIFEDVTLKPFFSGGYIWVNDAPYYGSYGGGLEMAALLSNRLRNVSTVQWRRHDHTDNWYLPTNSQYRGVEFTATSGLQFALSNFVTLFTTGTASRYETDTTPAQSYWLYGLTGGMSFRFADPVLKTNLPWSVTLSVTENWWRYDAPDATIDPNTMRTQADTIASLTFAVPFDDSTTLSVTGSRYVRTATLPNYAFDNNSLMFGIGWRF